MNVNLNQYIIAESVGRETDSLIVGWLDSGKGWILNQVQDDVLLV